MQGMYVPYWTYDAETQTDYTGQRGTVYYDDPPGQRRRQRPPRDGDAAGRAHPLDAGARPGGAQLRRRAGPGLESLPKRFTDALAPWDLSVLSAYEPKFLAGFRAEGYTVPVEDGYGEARQIMNAVIEGDVRRDIGGDQQQIGQLSTSVGALTFKHVLLPVWLAAYRYRGKSFRFVVNGRTGSVEGERPYSPVKIAIAVAVALIIAGIIAYLQISQGGGSDAPPVSPIAAASCSPALAPPRRPASRRRRWSRRPRQAAAHAARSAARR